VATFLANLQMARKSTGKDIIRKKQSIIYFKLLATSMFIVISEQSLITAAVL